MSVARVRALTHEIITIVIIPIRVEMSVARVRALTLLGRTRYRTSLI